MSRFAAPLQNILGAYERTVNVRRPVALVGALFVVATVLVIILSAGSFAKGSTDECAEEPRVVASTIEGTPCAETIVAPEGVTEVVGAGGDDVIVAGEDVISIAGGAGNDVIVGSPDVEEIRSGSGDDQIYLDLSALPAEYSALSLPVNDCPDPNPNPINLSAFNDICFGGDQNQLVFAGDGDDVVFGERGNDQLHGEGGRDRIYGSVGDDLLTGGPGDDILVGGNGSDNVIGNDGDDLIRGDTVGDVRDYGASYAEGLNGGDGDDTISFASAITPGFRNADIPAPERFNAIGGSYPNFPTTTENRGVYIDLNETVNGQTVRISTNGINKDGGGTDTLGSDFENIVGSPFADYLEGDAGPNMIYGGGGPDVILGMGGEDFLLGGGDSDHLDGGTEDDYANGESGTSNPADSNYCVAEVEDNCDRTSPGVQTRSTNLVKVGSLTEEPYYSLSAHGTIYLTGGTGNESIRADYQASDRSLTFESTGVPFDESQDEGCQYSDNDPNDPSGNPDPNDHFAKCSAGSSSLLDIINLSGSSGVDDISIYEANLPYTTSVFIQGGLNGDTNLKGSDETEDVIIDGPDVADDVIYGFDRSDSLYQSLGKDKLYGGEGGDVLYASEICEDNTLNGGANNDNITWAALPAPQRTMTPGVFASIIGTNVGRNTGGSAPTCSNPGGSFDSMEAIEHLEGSSGRDVLKGGPEDNTLLGRAGADELYGFGGDDFLHTHSGDYDLVIDCGSNGTGSSPGDTLVRDRRRNDLRDNQIDCETSKMSEADEEYEFAHDVNILSEAPRPVGLYRLGERYGTSAYVSSGIGVNASNAFVGGYDLNRPGVVPFSEDTSVWLNGSTGYIDLGNPTSGSTYIYDPATYGGSGFSVSLWVKFNSGSSYPTNPQFQYIFSKMAGSGSSAKGFFMRRNSAGKIVFGTKRTAWSSAQVVESSGTVGGTGWHHLVGTISGKTVTLYVDKNKTQNYNPSLTTTAFPDGWNSSDFVLGRGLPSPSALPGTIDSLAIYPVALSDCQVRRHFDVGTTTDPIPGC